jgi:cytochrome c oxidase subunit 1
MTFLPQFIMGSQGMPRRYYNYVEQFQTLHQYSTVGSWILGVGFIIIAIYLVISLRSKEKAPSNPWGSRTLEWMTSSPPTHHNFDYTPVVVHGPYDYHKPINEFRLGIEGSDHAHDEHKA